MPEVSIIVPVFNVEQYLAQCLDSLVVQDLRSLEIIVVNDGSTDESSQIAARYAESHANVRLINQENRGLSEARNTGLRAATGPYIGFVDGDDWVHTSMYAEMLRTAQGTGADLVVTNGYLCSDTTRSIKPIQDFKVWKALNPESTGEAFNPRKQPELFLLDTSACKRLYRREFLDRLDFKFVPGKIFEDVPTHYRLLLNAECVALLDRPFYFYRTDRLGRITARTDASLFHVFDVMTEVTDDLGQYLADDTIWANFIWFQNWVLRWLRNQIEPSLAPDFDLRCVEFAHRFPSAAIDIFNSKFHHDARALDFVRLQTSGTLSAATLPRRGGQPYAEYASTRHLGNDPIGFFNRDPNTFTPDVWGWVCIEYGIRSILDIGCGIGTNLSWFDEYGFEVLGVEGHPRAVSASLLPGRVVQHDFTKGPWAPDRRFDLCLCTEFAEHVKSEFENNWMVAADRCDYVLLAAAPPGQRGYHHVNEQPDSYWIARFESRGFTHEIDVSRRLRETCDRKPATWGRNNLLFFRRRTPDENANNDASTTEATK